MSGEFSLIFEAEKVAHVPPRTVHLTPVFNLDLKHQYVHVNGNLSERKCSLTVR